MEIKNKLILVIDDEEELRHNIAKILTLLGFSVLEAEDGEKGYETIINNEIDFVISDIKMPVMDGYELLGKIRENEKKKHIPFIFLTSNIDRDQQRKGMVLGADDYITKPFTTEELATAVKVRLERAGIYNDYYDEKFSKIIKGLENKAYIDESTGLPNIVSLKEKLDKVIKSKSNYLMFLFQIDGAEELENFLSVKSYKSIVTNISEKLRTCKDGSIELHSISDRELAVIHDNGTKEINTEYINNKITELKRILDAPVVSEDIELSFTSSGGVYKNDNETDIEEIIHNIRIAERFSQKVGGSNFTVYSPFVKEKYNNLSNALVKKHLHVTKKHELTDSEPVTDNFETKVFFLYPQSIIQTELIKNIVKNEYSAFIINDHKKLLNLLKRYTNSIVFINIDSVLSEPEWEEYTKMILTNPDYEGVRVGILSHKDDRGKAEIYLMKLMVHCGFITLKSGLKDSLSVILKVLEANEAKGKRKHVRVNVENNENTFVDAKINNVVYRADILNISSAGLTAVFHNDAMFRDSTEIDEMNLCLRGVIIHTKGKIMGTRPYNDTKLYVVLFDNKIAEEEVDKIHSYVFKTKQEQLEEEMAVLKD